MLFIMGFIVDFSSWTVLGAKTFVDFDCWNPRIIFLCLEGLSVAASDVEPSGLTDAGAYIMIDLCLLLVFPIIF